MYNIYILGKRVICRDFLPIDKKMTNSPVGDDKKKRLLFSENVLEQVSKNIPFLVHKDLKVLERL